MRIPFLLSKLFSKYFTGVLVFFILISIAWYFLIPQSFYDLILNSISDLLKTRYGSGGSKIKIANGLNKLSKIVAICCFLAFVYLNFWKWLIDRLQKNEGQVFSIPDSKNFQIGKKDWIIIGSISIIAILLRIFWINQSLWQDELAVYRVFMEKGIINTIFPSDSMGSHPFMQIIVKLFTNVTGVSEFTMRFPIFFTSIVSITIIYFVSLKISGQRMAAAISALFLSVHSYHIYYSFQMRGYVILMFFCILSTYFLFKFFNTQNQKAKILLIITNILMVYTHLYSFYFVLTQHLILIGFLLYNNSRSKNFVSPAKVIEYLSAFLVSVIIMLLIYLPQFPAIFMNILDEGQAKLHFFEHVARVFTTSHYVIAYSNYMLLNYLFITSICIAYIVFVKKNSSDVFVFFTILVLFSIIALIPSGSDFHPRYLTSEIPLIIIICSFVINQLWVSKNKSLQIVSVLLVAFYLSLSFLAYPKTYRPIQNYKGAVELIHSTGNNKCLILANSLGKTEIQFYDKKIIPLNTTQELDSLMKLEMDLYVITAFRGVLDENSMFAEDKKNQMRIEKEFALLKTFEGEFPVKVWYSGAK